MVFPSVAGVPSTCFKQCKKKDYIKILEHVRYS